MHMKKRSSRSYNPYDIKNNGWIVKFLVRSSIVGTVKQAHYLLAFITIFAFSMTGLLVIDYFGVAIAVKIIYLRSPHLAPSEYNHQLPLYELPKI
jgi:hypothetical protein